MEKKSIFYEIVHIISLKCVCLSGGKRKPTKVEIRAHWLLIGSDEVELFNL